MIQESAANYRITPVRRHGQLTPAESALAAEAGTDQEAWDGATYVYDGQKDDFGNYFVEEGDVFGVESVTPMGSDTALAPSGYSVFYMVDGGSTKGQLDNTDTVVAAGDSIESRAGGMPEEQNADGYLLVVVKGKLVNSKGEAVELTSGAAWSNYAGYGWLAHAQRFLVKEPTVSKSLEGAVAFEAASATASAAAATEGEIADGDFVYTGKNIKVGFAVDGEALDTADYALNWVSYPEGITPDPTETNGLYTVDDGLAGTYKAHLVGKGEYAGTEADVEFAVAKLDLSTMSIEAKDYAKDDATYSTAVITSPDQFSVGNVFLASTAEVTVAVNGYETAAGTSGDTFKNMGAAGNFRYLLSAKANSENVTGSCVVTVRVFGTLTPKTDFKYGTKKINGTTAAAPFETFYLDRGQSFDPEMLNIAGVYDNFEYTVTKNGVEVESFDEPGAYTVRMEQTPAANYSKGGSASGTFVVKKTYVDYSAATVFMFVDGTAIENNGTVEYDGQAVEPTFVAKNNGKVVDPANYTVELQKGGEPVESIVDPANDYAAVVEFADGTKLTIDFDVTKATIDSVQANAEFYALPADGTAAQPAFTGSTEADFDKGLKFELPADQISVVYYEAELDSKGNSNPEDDEWVKVSATTPAIDPEDLTEAGDYLAEVNILATNPTMAGTGLTAHVKVAESVAYADVDANAWYAESVYKAAQSYPVKFEYMTGIAGTNLFMPEADLTRAQTAQVVYNMAGGDDMFNLGNVQYFPTKFSDVSPLAWYAKPVYWASEAGVVTGMGDTGEFAPEQSVTREQVATMLYRYVASQGKDVSGQADLSAYTDGASVSAWAADAVEWAVAEGYMGVGTDQLRPQENISRAEMAAMSVRVQPDGAYLPL